MTPLSARLFVPQPFVYSLSIKQLLPPERDESDSEGGPATLNDDASTSGSSPNADVDTTMARNTRRSDDGSTPDHVPLRALFARLMSLRHLSLVFAVDRCAMNFESERPLGDVAPFDSEV